MRGPLTFGRSAERSLRRAADDASADGVADGRLYFYTVLARVAFRHAYFNQEDGRCPALAVLPTGSSAALMRSVGLQFRDEGTGFSVLYDERRTDSLLGYLRRQEKEPPAPAAGRRQVWTRLSFALVARDRLFVNFTRMPLAANPSERNFYFTNRCARASAAGAPALLNPPGCPEGGRLVDVVGPQVVRRTPPDVERVELRDLSGEVVVCLPRCVPRSLLRSGAPPFDCKQVAEAPPSHDVVCTPRVALDLSLLPEDLYVIDKVGYDGRPVRPPHAVLYTLSDPVPIAFVDLLFTNPTGDGPGVYPVRDLFGPDARVVPTDYTLDFDARACTWIYDVAPRDVRRPLEGLRIEAPPPVAFSGPVDVRLADGSPAYRFRSEAPLVLEQQPRLVLRLLGRRAPVGLDAVLMDRMPAASARQVEPDGTTAEDGGLGGRVPVIVHV